MNEELSVPLKRLEEEINQSIKIFDHPIYNAYRYLFGTTQYEILQRPFKNKEIPSYLEGDAWVLYDEWYDTDKDDLIHSGRRVIPHPAEKTIEEYITFLAFQLTSLLEDRKHWKRSLQSFLQYIYRDIEDDAPNPKETIDYIRTIFPKEMKLIPDEIYSRSDDRIEKKEVRHILRKIREEQQPIDVVAYSEIIQNLISKAIDGRPNAQRGALETLGIIWLCFTCVSAGFSIELNQLHSLRLNSLLKASPNEHFIFLQTSCGYRKIAIAKHVHDLLLELARSVEGNRFFTMDMKSLRKGAFRSAVLDSSHASKLGTLTFRTMLAQPHHAIGHRNTHR